MAFPGPHRTTTCIPVAAFKQITADDATAARVTVPFACTIVSVVGYAHTLAGTTVFTDVDLMLLNGTTTLLSARLGIVNASTVVTGSSAVASLSATASKARLAANDVLKLDIDVTGGSSPTLDGVGFCVYVVPDVA